MNKKAVELAMNTLVIAVIALIVFAVVVAIFTNVFRGETKPIDCGLNDYDKDGVANMFDKCPCDSDKSHQDVESCVKVCGQNEPCK